MFGNTLCAAEGYWLFPDSSIHAKHPDSNSELGGVLDQH